MIGFDEALAIIRREAQQLPMQVQHCAPSQALGRVLAEAVVAGEDLPPFDNSAMDGFALYAAASGVHAGSEFDVAGAQAAGDTQVRGTPGAWEIMTGARMPEGMDAVVPVEQVEVLSTDSEQRPQRIRLNADVGQGQNVRRCGEDVRLGRYVLAAGTLVEAQQLMLLAALGVQTVAVARRPRVAIISTGRELVDDPAQALASGEIRNSNGPFLAARVHAAGAELVLRETVGDDPAAFIAALDRALAAGAEIVVSTGAVSMGRFDFVPDALRSIGARIHFHKVRIRPGKPLLLATLAGGQLYFGLPGNPVSSAVGLRFFVEPALRVLLGMAPETPLRARLADAFDKRTGLHFMLKGRLEVDGSGQLQARILAGQESFRMTPLLAANAWIMVPETMAAPVAGNLVEIHGLGHLQAPMVGEVLE
ncbi:MAG: gephyrin-like molybdotransferase Glp [Luteimonas sp.]